MVVVRRILSPLLLLVGFCFVAAGLYRSFITFSANVDWVVVGIGAVLMVFGLLVQTASVVRRLIGSGLLLGALALFALGYPLYGMSGIGQVQFLSMLWIPAVALATAAVLIARGRTWWSLLLVIVVTIVYVAIGLVVGFGPIGWWPVNVRLPEPVMEWLSIAGAGYWPAQVLFISVLVVLAAWAGALVDGLARRGRPIPGEPDGTMVR